MDLKIVAPIITMLSKYSVELAVPNDHAVKGALLFVLSAAASACIISIVISLSTRTSPSGNASLSQLQGAAWIVGLVMTNAALQLVAGWAIDTPQDSEANPARSVESIDHRIIDLVFLNPAIEEVVFRWLLLLSLLKVSNAIFAVIVTSAAFGIIHEGVHSVLVNSIFGIGLALSVLKTGRLIHAYLAHCTSNLLGIVLSLVGWVSLR